MSVPSSDAVSDDVARIAATFFERRGLGRPINIVPVTGGRNNRVYRIIGTETTAILKQYYHQPTGDRDRWAAEIAWVKFCHSHGMDCIPKLWDFDAATRTALFSEAAGHKLRPGEVTADHVQQAADFVRQVNTWRDTPEARALPLAAEACFSLAEHLDCVDRRIARLRAVPAFDDIASTLRAWITTALDPMWNAVRAQVVRGLSDEDYRRELEADERRLSPSDFGFHNALAADSGRLRFLDFEYAGWDDPAKLVCDFFWQVDVPAPRETLETMLGAFDVDPDSLRDRVRRLFTVYGIKWCTIVLNDFLPSERQRRDYSEATSTKDDRRSQQFSLAVEILNDAQRTLVEGVCI